MLIDNTARHRDGEGNHSRYRKNPPLTEENMVYFLRLEFQNRCTDGSWCIDEVTAQDLLARYPDYICLHAFSYMKKDQREEHRSPQELLDRLDQTLEAASVSGENQKGSDGKEHRNPWGRRN